MQKPNSLRKALTDAVPVLRTNPDMLCLRLDDGNNTATLARSLSFEKRYTLNIVVTDLPTILTCCLCRLCLAAGQSAGHHDNRRGEKKKDLPGTLTLITTAASMSVSACY
ncbi:putative prophage, tail completion protein [Klebsiella pneumoniae subsp. pneumoniae]|uniref:Putative prophage, tail completion protein n=1 Tax=Klebsiella pneumoniae subsp. pneumoniae TaxID=72407 RepID=A0A377Z5E9_KLEPN|nr:putative prophage, tail completion protein [Klebsiella pneumoniae subsp. pneumoniae]